MTLTGPGGSINNKAIKRQPHQGCAGMTIPTCNGPCLRHSVMKLAASLVGSASYTLDLQSISRQILVVGASNPATHDTFSERHEAVIPGSIWQHLSATRGVLFLPPPPVSSFGARTDSYFELFLNMPAQQRRLPSRAIVPTNLLAYANYHFML
eukprot:6416638-Amphidinium_carterae.2